MSAQSYADAGCQTSLGRDLTNQNVQFISINSFAQSKHYKGGNFILFCACCKSVGMDYILSIKSKLLIYSVLQPPC